MQFERARYGRLRRKARTWALKRHFVIRYEIGEESWVWAARLKDMIHLANGPSNPRTWLANFEGNTIIPRAGKGPICLTGAFFASMASRSSCYLRFIPSWPSLRISLFSSHPWFCVHLTTTNFPELSLTSQITPFEDQPKFEEGLAGYDRSAIQPRRIWYLVHIPYSSRVGEYSP